MGPASRDRQCGSGPGAGDGGAPLRMLAVECATRQVSAAVLEGEELVAEVTASAQRDHAEGLLPAVDAALRLAGLGPDGLDAFAVSIGPGSFTGLRVGLATVKGLAFGRPAPVAPVSTLAARALGWAGAGEPIAVALDAQRGEVYAAVYTPGDLGPLVAEGCYRPAELADRLPQQPCLLVGEGAAPVAALLRERGVAHRLAPLAVSPPRALPVGLLGLRMLAAGQGVRADALVPRYLRRAEAESKRMGTPFEAGLPAGTTLSNGSPDR